MSAPTMELLQHFNGLTPSQDERLAVLIEEMGEAIQIACKVLRHGYESHDPTNPRYQQTNRQLLEVELGHVRHAMIRLCDYGDLDKEAIHESADKKARSIGKWLHHQ